MASWVWLLAAFSLTVLLLDAAGVWMCIRFGSDSATTVEDLSSAARQIAGGNFAWMTPVRSNGQPADPDCNFKAMALALEQLEKDGATRLTLAGGPQLARGAKAQS